MKDFPSSPTTYLTSGVVALILGATLSGCTLLGLGAAAGAAVGGCALLDTDEDDQVTTAEFATGLFQGWDDDGDATLTEAEFNAGVGSRGIYSAWSDDFDAWDANDDDVLTQAEFVSAVEDDPNATSWADDRCDDLGL